MHAPVSYTHLDVYKRQDFDGLPVFADFGGWSRAETDFTGQLIPLIQQINAAVAG